MKKKTLFLAALALLIVLFGGAAWFYNAQQEKAAAERAEANRASLMRAHAPTLGRADAPVVIVEFLDPACETCAAFYPLVKQIMAAHPDKIRLVLRWAPFHPGSDKVVAMLEAARRQGKLWPALEALLGSQRAWSPNHRPQAGLALQRLEGLGLNLEQLAFDVTAPEIAQRIAQDLADADKLQVTKTPEFFVNGRPMPSFGEAPLRELVDRALAEAAGR